MKLGSNITKDDRRIVEAIWRAGVDATHPRVGVPVALDRIASRRLNPRSIRDFKSIFVVGAGKASGAMGHAVETWLRRQGVAPNQIKGIIATAGSGKSPTRFIKTFFVRGLGQNVPTASAVACTKKMISLLKNTTKDDLVIGVFSGGGSAMCCLPLPSVTLKEKQRVTTILQSCGASIAEMNAVRRHLSQVKGGRLLGFGTPGQWINLLISDVPGDDPAIIASGPLVLDATSARDAMNIIKRYRIDQSMPPSVMRHLRLKSNVDDSRKRGRTLPNIITEVVANNATAACASAQAAREMGFHVVHSKGLLTNDGLQTAQWWVNELSKKRLKPPCLIAGGEPTIVLPRSHGQGGRNTHIALLVLDLLGMTKMQGVTALFAGTDGEDGSTQGAGAFIDARVLARAEKDRIQPRYFLDAFDSYSFFDAVSASFRPGLTGTNVMDLSVAVVR